MRRRRDGSDRHPLRRTGVWRGVLAASLLLSSAATGLATQAGAAVPAAAAAAAPAAAASLVKQVPYAATFKTKGQSMWGPGATAGPGRITTPLFHQSWNESGGFDEVTSVELCLPLVPCINFGDYGARFTASTSGHIGMSQSLNGLSGGTVGVDYPVTFGITGPADDSFAQGAPVTITTTAPTVAAGASISSVYPSFSSMSLDASFDFHASAEGEICVGGCVGGSIFDIDIPGSPASGSLLTLSASDLTLVQGLGLTHCFGAAENALFGTGSYANEGGFCENNGYMAFPDVKLGTTSVDGEDLFAGGHQEYMVLPISAVDWVGKLTSLPTGFPNLEATFDGTGVSYTTISDVLTGIMTEHQELTFEPSTNITLDLKMRVPYSVLDPDGNVVMSDRGTTVTFPLGHSLQLNPTRVLHITPTVSLAKTTITDRIYDRVRGSNRVEALSLTASIGGCCEIFDGIDVDLGPVWTDTQSLGGADLERVDNTWELGGFNTVTLAPFTVAPNPNPISAGSVPPVLPATEGASTSGVVAKLYDIDPAASTQSAAPVWTASVDWGDGTVTPGTVTGTGAAFQVEGAHTYAEVGTYRITTTVREVSNPAVHAVTIARADVRDAPLTVTSAPPLMTVLNVPTPEGAVVARFTDANPTSQASEFSATVNWGDTSQASVAQVASHPDGGFVVTAPSHTYALRGTPTVAVVIKSVDGSTVTAYPPTTTADAPIVATALSNSALTADGSRVLLWRGSGSAPLAHLKDSEPGARLTDYIASVSWGDGTTSAGVVKADPAGGFTVSGTHTYAPSALGLKQVTVDVAAVGIGPVNRPTGTSVGTGPAPGLAPGQQQWSKTRVVVPLLAYGFSSGGTFALGNRTAVASPAAPAVTNTFWGAGWAAANPTSGKSSSTFQGFVKNAAPNTRMPLTIPPVGTPRIITGRAPASVPSFMLVAVTPSITPFGAIGDVAGTRWAIMRTAAGYGPTPTTPGTGTVVALLP